MQPILQATSPGNTQPCVDVDNIDPRSNRHPQVFVRGSGPAVESQWNARRLLDLPDSLDVEVLSLFTGDHVPAHAMRVSDRGSQDIDSGGLNKASRVGCGRKAWDLPGHIIVNLGAASNVADLTLNQDLGIDRLESLYGPPWFAPRSLRVTMSRGRRRSYRMRPPEP